MNLVEDEIPRWRRWGGKCFLALIITILVVIPWVVGAFRLFAVMRKMVG